MFKETLGLNGHRNDHLGLQEANEPDAKPTGAAEIAAAVKSALLEEPDETAEPAGKSSCQICEPELCLAAALNLS